MELILVTGMSGAGKTQAIHALEDIGYFCIDNIPADLIPQFIDLITQGGEYGKVAVVTDLRAGMMFNDFSDSIKQLKAKEIPFKLLFLSAGTEVLERRYSETRRLHPLRALSVSTADAIQKEAEILKPIMDLADYHIDTSMLSAAELRQRILSLFSEASISGKMFINCVSFGYKNGIPSDADIVIDVRMLPNPYYEEDLRDKVGLDAPVRDYVLNREVTQEFLAKLKSMLEYVIPLYVKEGKSQLVMAFGCTGGHHRSVAICEEVNRYAQELGYNSRTYHRDISKSM